MSHGSMATRKWRRTNTRGDPLAWGVPGWYNGSVGVAPDTLPPGKGLLCGACTLQSRHQQTDWRTMAISKSVRFEVFARDAFTCQYCGQHPPDTVLELDHIHRAKGGSDELLNLITSCWECNRGKAAKVLSEIAPRPDADLMFLRVQQEITEAKRYLEAKRQRDNIFNKVRIALSETWIELLKRDLPGYATVGCLDKQIRF